MSDKISFVTKYVPVIIDDNWRPGSSSFNQGFCGQRAKGKNSHLMAYIFRELYLSSKVNW